MRSICQFLVSHSLLKKYFYRHDKDPMTYEDVALLCDLFYLPFEHGSGGTQILHDFNWLKTHAHVVCNNHASNGCTTDVAGRAMKDPEVHC